MKVKLKELGTISTGNTPNKNISEFYDAEDIGFVKPDIISDLRIDYIVKTTEYLSEAARTKARIVKRDAVFVTCIGSIGKVGITKGDEFAFNQQINAIEPNEKILPKYLAYSIWANKKKLQAIANAPVVPIINKTQFGEFEIDITDDVDEQVRIVKLLDKVCAIITDRKTELEKLDELIKARFVELFGNPLDSNKVNYIFTECVEFNPKKSEVKDLQDLEVSFVPMECVGVDGSFSIKGTGLVSDYYSGYTYFRDGDVLLAKITPCFENGKVAIATDCKNGIGFGTTEFHVSRPLKGITNSVWIKYLLKNDMVHDLATINMSGSAGQKRIQTPFFNKLKVYVPPIEEQEQFADFVHQVDKSKFAVQNALDTAQTLMDSLMQQYFG